MSEHPDYGGMLLDVVFCPLLVRFIYIKIKVFLRLLHLLHLLLFVLFILFVFFSSSSHPYNNIFLYLGALFVVFDPVTVRRILLSIKWKYFGSAASMYVGPFDPFRWPFINRMTY